MKTPYPFIYSIVLVLAFACASTNNTPDNALLFETNPLLKIKEITYQEVVAGRQETPKNYVMNVLLLSNPKNATLDSIFFRGIKAKLVKTENELYTAKLQEEHSEDLVMSVNVIEELNNELPEPSKMPFNLKDSECVISYIDNSRTKFLKTTKIKQVQSVYYPSTPPKK